ALSQPMGHTAGPETAVCETAVAFWQQVAGYAAQFNVDRPRIFDQLTPSLRRIDSHSDGFIERVDMTIGFRLPPEIDIDALQTTVLGWAGDAQITFRGREVAFRGSRSSELARAFVRALSEEGVKAQFKVKSGTSDMNVVGPVWGCPILAYGPGDSAFDHTPHEHIDLDDYHRAIQVLTHVLAHL
ncbi:MAG: M20/M25/M40 family metallo-hydrolase, partial [Anaerolineae bacterium]|nr:M20/M25/M40 family metallo-hydrolase [Anaerolineae bacterium]